MPADAAAARPVADEDLMRAQFYALLSRLMTAPPDQEILGDLAGLRGDDSDIGRALAALGDAARATTAAAVEDEFNALFIGLSRGEIVPYGSYYMTGFLHEKPLADLRDDLAALGVERAPGHCQPEDHAGFICEVLCGLILGTYGEPDIEVQKKFFDTHLSPWADALFADIDAAPSAAFYRPVAAIGRLFMAVERDAFSMA
ncbi:TorD/DmsD family molecular chaperone [Novispirillum sp. DQ9]|uniref:TorD/DmsD family molecular chaperone n=1 Tax=Novispirillum sp. DQ9 TaxID=3398612 RepID=UPI003C7B9206